MALDLRRVGKGDLTRAGGKGANLGELIRGGFPVPAGFVVSTAAYDRFVAANHLAGLVPAALREANGGATLRAAFERAPIPPAVERAVAAAYRALGSGPVAVRSSATAEDLPDAAFAGQQETFLNIDGERELIDAVRACWASLWTDRAIAYRQRQAIEQETAKLAVVVQRMAPAAAAGVMFTANPVTGARDEIVVDANPGLGEAVVSGLVTPDHFVLAKGSGRIKAARRGRREAIVRALPGGGTAQVAGDAASGHPALPRPALRELARLGAAIERHFGRPQDVEWTWNGDRFFIVQARPITALPEPRRGASDRRARLDVAAELFAIRPYPFDLTTFTRA
ncbi:MAG TPA: PEP/pyruvate-binding domain-containing protein, partial [Thermomicrobiales bacterium]|nr:PEP/pyruvate-binding domain-containing protein [Thermomicrobiales bacterium]